MIIIKQNITIKYNGKRGLNFNSKKNQSIVFNKIVVHACYLIVMHTFSSRLSHFRNFFLLAIVRLSNDFDNVIDER